MERITKKHFQELYDSGALRFVGSYCQGPGVVAAAVQTYVAGGNHLYSTAVRNINVADHGELGIVCRAYTETVKGLTLYYVHMAYDSGKRPRTAVYVALKITS